ncbi:TPA: hypothetical protein TVN86_001987 [Streptococcus equi subsp. zooepidemicus]|nr:hypothetical protein [Streptococcus equi subsp. zooepidemicus]HEL1117582.1 hypothetical protein [Streptococcus equi subsp. zooepidemicus]HEL1171707.1 hypothetical protein [Streptococcus equi subsp. zooepidemicus]HEL1223338.1 hypothetical protein [Streptococcus equi subsp. zooepidemicus]
MADEVLKLQMLSVEEETDEVDGMRFSTTSLSWCGNWRLREPAILVPPSSTSLSWCGNWSAISAFGC